MGRIRVTVPLIVMALLVIGCGRMDVDIHTDVRSPTQLVQSLNMQADGTLGTMLTTAFDPGRMRADGWQVSVKAEGNRSIVTATKTLHQNGWRQGLLPASSPTSPLAAPGIDFSFDVRENLFDREYRVRMILPSNTSGRSGIASNPQIQQLSQQAAQQMLHVRWKVTLPGTIIETNADSREGNSGTWNLDVLSLEKGREMVIASRERRAGNMAAAGIGGLALVGLIILRITRPGPRPRATDPKR